MSSLRSRLLVAIGIAVVVAVGVSLATAALLVRRSVAHEATRALARQADVLAAQLRAQPASSAGVGELGTFLETQQERVAILRRDQAELLLPPAGAALRAGHGADGTVRVRGTRFLFSARPVGARALVLLRAASLKQGDWRPFGIGFVIAALVGAALAALAAFLLARAISRPISRVAAASLALAAGEEPRALADGSGRASTELAALAAAFDHMAAELALTREAERSFLLSVSHELKTPLTSIAMNAEGLEDGVIPREEAAAVIRSEAARLERLVRDLLDLARLNQRAFGVELRPVDLAAVVREAGVRYEQQAAAVGVRLVVSAPAEAPALGDADRLLQVLSNLIENALRSTPAGGEVRVEAAPGRLTVADTGPGLDPEELPRAFERFFLYGRYARNRAVGTGLGLAIVKELTEALGGSISVASAPGEGTRFVVELPRTPAPDRVPVEVDS